LVKPLHFNNFFVCCISDYKQPKQIGEMPEMRKKS